MRENAPDTFRVLRLAERIYGVNPYRSALLRLFDKLEFVRLLQFFDHLHFSKLHTQECVLNLFEFLKADRSIHFACNRIFQRHTDIQFIGIVFLLEVINSNFAPLEIPTF